ncbi:hypothetical protein LVISKB_2139 [Levilactobacillus brevis KB290]|uniref:Uncharacterized protein n=1 Tax=Levilactobacillus brevis KB290 TaxID=1001583 RepID=M5AG16_LEVBR|nr:hypothetical protein LVISKB_2139 [Levilactobacillus brevis KB290]
MVVYTAILLAMDPEQLNEMPHEKLAWLLPMLNIHTTLLPSVVALVAGYLSQQ